MAIADIKSAFRLLPINSVGFVFDNQLFFDKCLPMGLTLSCYYFEAFSTFLYWAIDREISNVGSLHYLDDFLFICKADSPDCLIALNKFIEMAEFFGIPLASEKMVLPTPCIEFLGIPIDSINMKLCLPESKIHRIKSLLMKLIGAKKTTLREL